MECFYHQQTPAAATCLLCGKRLCRECATRNERGLCDDCAAQVNSDKKAQRRLKQKTALIDTTSEMIGAIAIGLVAAIIMKVIYAEISPNDPNSFMICALAFFIPFGWRMITYLEQWLPGFLVESWIYLIYLGMKLMFSILVGIPCFIYQIIKFIRGIIKGVKMK